ncbi:MAG: flagellar FliJ family protein [bacterium]
MAFAYRLQKVINHREQKREEQREVVKKAEAEVKRIQTEIDDTKNQISELRKKMYTYHHTMMESFDIFIKHLREELDRLENQKMIATQRVIEEKEKLAECEKAVKVLEKHKEKCHEIYLEEEKQAEMRALDEVAGLKHFAKMRLKQQEDMDDEAKEEAEKLLEYIEGLELNEFGH